MKKFTCGLLVGLLLAASGIVLAQGQALRLIINGADITAEAQPIIIDGRTLVPARALAERLGAKVVWDEANYAVVVTGGVQVGALPPDLEANNSPASQPVSQIEKEEEFIPSEWVVENELGRYGLTVKLDEKVGKYHIGNNKGVIVTPSGFAFDKSGKVFNMNIRGEGFRFRMVDGKMYVNKNDLDSLTYFDEEIVYKTIASPND